MNPTQEQVDEAITDIERLEIIREAQRLEREAEQVWRQYCIDNGIVEQKPKAWLTPVGKFWLCYAAVIVFLGLLVIAVVSK